MSKKRIDETGHRYGRLLVLGFAYTLQNGSYWKCKCDCGNEKIISGPNLRSGRINSCGCLSTEKKKSRVGDKHPLWGKRKENCVSWKGGKMVRQDGYIVVYCPDHHRSVRRYVLEHILVMEKMLGRPLAEGEIIHHCNRDKADNRPFNLRLFPSTGEHISYHAKMRREGVSL